MTKLSIIFPVYNVEKYVRSSFESIFKQGLDDTDFEVIVVNDGTQDRSMEIIDDLIRQHDNITVINQENQGLSVARNNGIELAKGEYVLMPDSDDMLIDNSLKPLLKKAIETKVDLLVADFVEIEDTDMENAPSICQKTLEFKEKNGEKLLLEDLNPNQCYVWRTLFRTDFIRHHHLKFVPGVVYQDVPFTHAAYINAERCLRTSWKLNIYRRERLDSATYSFNKKKAMDFCIVIGKTWELTSNNNTKSNMIKKIKDDVFISFQMLNCNTTHSIKDRLVRYEIIDYLRKIAPDIKFKNGAKQQIVSLLFRKMPHTYVQLRYLYGIIIEDMIYPFYKHKIKNNN